MKIISLVLLFFTFTLPFFTVRSNVDGTTVYAEMIADESKILQKIIDTLYITTAITDDKLGKPILIISESEKDARYDSRTNEIIVGTKFIEFAVSRKEVKKSIYRFVMGHELGHYIQRVQGKDFNACHKKRATEEKADFYGVFTNMLNGNKEIKYNTEKVISAFYAYFKPLADCYPPLENRLKAAEAAIAKAKYLHHLFKTANYLTAAEEYDFALDIYEHLLQHYGSAEFYNNKGILLLMRGIEKNTRNLKEYKRFFFPIELDLSTKLKIVKDDENLNFVKYNDTADFIEAEKAFEKARSVGGKEERYLRNRLSALILQREFTKADSLLQECIGDDNLKELLRALLLLQKDATDKTGIELLQSLAENENHLSELAEMNLIVLEKRELQAPSDFLTVCVPVEEIYLSRGQVAAMEAKPLSDAEHIESISINGIYTVIKQKTGRQILVQTLSAAQTCDAVAVRHYPVSNYGLNFTAHSYTDEGNIRNKVVFLDEQTAAVVTEL